MRREETVRATSTKKKKSDLYILNPEICRTFAITDKRKYFEPLKAEVTDSLSLYLSLHYINFEGEALEMIPSLSYSTPKPTKLDSFLQLCFIRITTTFFIFTLLNGTWLNLSSKRITSVWTEQS